MSATVTRLDGWASALTKLGTQFDKLKSYVFLPNARLTPQQCADLYHHNALAARICDITPEDGFREGVCVKDEDGAEVDEIKSRLNDLDAVKSLTDAAVWGNVFGGAGVYLSVADGKPQSEPLDPTRVTKVNALRVVDQRDLVVATWYGDPLDPKFDTPETFRFAQPGTSPDSVITSGVTVHESRFVWFAGSRTGRRERRANNGWHYSKLQKVTEQLLRVGVSWDNAAQMLQTASQTVMKIGGLRDAMVSDTGADALEKRALAVDMARGVTRSLWIDAEGEDVMQLSTPLTGVDTVLDRLGSLLAASTGIPVTKLFGTQPTGLGATGAADERTWNNRVESYRMQELKPAVDKLVACLASELKVKGDLTITFPSLDRPTEAEKAALRLQIAQADQIYVTNQIVHPEEIAVSRFGGQAWSMETQLKDGPRDELEFPAAPGTPTHEEQLALQAAKGQQAEPDADDGAEKPVGDAGAK